MAKFAYVAISESGTKVTGVVDADSTAAATTLLNQRGFIPSKVTPENASTGIIGRINDAVTPIRPWDIILFSKQLGTMLKAGVPIVKIFQILENQTDNRKLKQVTAEIIQDIEQGLSLYESFKKHPVAFSPLYCSMVQAGEASGSLPEVLDRLIYVIEHEYKVRRDVKAALAYPVIVVIFLFIAFMILLTFVVPRFVTVFQRAKVELPLPTRICMVLYTFIFHYWYLALGLTAAIILFLTFYLRTEQGKYVRDYILLRIPLIGPLYIKAAMSRFAAIFAILQSSGVAVLEIFKILSGTIGNFAISTVFDKVAERLREGRGISEPLKSAEYFPPMVVNMVAIGEESGNLDEMLAEVSKHYDVEVEYATHRLSTALGPILIVGLAVVVGFFALAIYLPMWDLAKTIH